ncbi:hypothetical protein [Marilutibacter maris]|uniref:hypothetical protein n=1 Tax=Marilutibacter maris TaxID=1605891 RepID=UPI001143D3D4|nr:hypothetical protein [Lysobacter maris]
MNSKNWSKNWSQSTFFGSRDDGGCAPCRSWLVHAKNADTDLGFDSNAVDIRPCDRLHVAGRVGAETDASPKVATA